MPRMKEKKYADQFQSTVFLRFAFLLFLNNRINTSFLFVRSIIHLMQTRQLGPQNF